MYRSLAAALVGTAVVLGSAVLPARADRLLVLEKDTHTLAIVDPRTLQVIARAPSGPDPHEVIADTDGKIAYISNYGGEGSELNTLSRVELATHRALSPLSLGALRSPHGLDFAGGELYFTAETSKVIGRYDPAKRSIDWVMGTGQARTHMLRVAADLKHIYTTNVRSGTVSILQSSRRRPFALPPGVALPAGVAPPPEVTLWDITTVPAGRGVEGFDLSPDGHALWAANAQDGTVTVIDLDTRSVTSTFPIPVRGANRLRFTPDGRHVLISGLGNFGGRTPDPVNLIVVDTATHRTVKSLSLGGGAAGILIPPSGKEAYVAVSGGADVAVVDLASFTVRGTIATHHQPDGMAWVSTP
jgi:YVTN family beta-propeller protein